MVYIIVYKTIQSLHIRRRIFGSVENSPPFTLSPFAFSIHPWYNPRIHVYHYRSLQKC